MTHESPADSHQEACLQDVLLAYIEARQRGEVVDKDRLLAEHPELRNELAECLADYEEVERMAEPLRAASSSTDIRSDRPADSGSDALEAAATASELGLLGDFRLLSEVGRGGMGVVYEAEQLSLRRRVALKVLPFAATLDARQLQRFKNEAQAAAILHHTNIVPVFAVGCERGVHFYAMQLIDGQSLAALIRQLQRQAGLRTAEERGPHSGVHSSLVISHDLPSATQTLGGSGPVPTTSKSLAETPQSLHAELSTQHATRNERFFRTAARLMLQAAQALDYAHAMGIVHRDIKPANLLLDLQGTLWVTDFGLAQFHTDAGLTRTGDILGTLRYMSPEQASGRKALLDPRTDVYSLGVTFYELLTLRPIFDAVNVQQLLDQILHAEPRGLRQIDKAIPAELETIILKAASKNADERYRGAGELAADLQRYLENKPILAQRPTLWDRARKWSRRHPSVLVAGMLLLALLSIGSLVTAALVHNEEKKTALAYQRERQRAEEAEARFKLAQRSVDELFHVSEEELADRPGMESLRKRLLTSVLSFYQEFIEQRRGDEQAQAELRETKQRVEQILADLSVLRAASRLHLLAQPAVHDDLRLTDAQREQVKTFVANFEQERKDAFAESIGLPTAERQRKFLEQARADDAEVNHILTDVQQVRLRQLRLQSEGPNAFRDPEVVAALQLTSEQRDRIRAIEEETLFAWFARRGPGGHSDGPPDGSRPPREPRPAASFDRILDVLTADQRRLWNEMTGAPFQGRLDGFPRSFGPPPMSFGPPR